jgi:hypothetical protein
MSTAVEQGKSPGPSEPIGEPNQSTFLEGRVLPYQARRSIGLKQLQSIESLLERSEIQNGLLFSCQQRISELESLRDDIRTGKVTPEQARDRVCVSTIDWQYVPSANDLTHTINHQIFDLFRQRRTHVINLAKQQNMLTNCILDFAELYGVDHKQSLRYAELLDLNYIRTWVKAWSEVSEWKD